MGARIQNTPSYVVFDRSFNQIVTIDAGAGQSETGQASYIVDSDLNSYYNLHSQSGSLGDTHATISINYGKLFFNVQLSYKVNFAEAGATLNNANYAVQYSNDGTNWTTLDSGGQKNANVTITRSSVLMSAQYVRFSNIQVQTSDATSVDTSVYECRLMGSG